MQRKRTIDFGIEQLGKRPVRKLDPPVRTALRLGAYQLAWTDQAVHAVVDDAVELVRAAGRERAVPFTNAVMRRLSQGLQGLVASLPEGRSSTRTPTGSPSSGRATSAPTTPSR